MAGASVNLRRLAADTREIPRHGMIAAAKASKTIVTQEGARLVGADGMRGKKRRPIKLRARDDIRTTATGAMCRVQGSVPGWVWITTGTDPHPIRRRRRGPMRRMVVQHPGTRGRRGWDRVVARITEVVPRIFTDELHRAVTR